MARCLKDKCNEKSITHGAHSIESFYYLTMFFNLLFSDDYLTMFFNLLLFNNVL